MRQLTRDPSNNPWAEMIARGDLIDRLEAAIIQWTEASEAADDAFANPLHTPEDLKRHGERLAETVRHLRSLVPDLSAGQRQARPPRTAAPARREGS